MSKSKVVLITDDQRQRLKIAQDKFYAILESHGFEDIEDHSINDRPLKEWHNLKFSSEKALHKIKIRNEYQKLIDDFTNHDDFEDICKSMVRHKNSTMTYIEIKYIWHLSTQDGWTERKIAIKFNRSKTCIHWILKRLRSWMVLV